MAGKHRRMRAGSWRTPAACADLTRGEIGTSTVVYSNLRVELDPSADTSYHALKHESAGMTG
jgi:hypothetical protein